MRMILSLNRTYVRLIEQVFVERVFGFGNDSRFQSNVCSTDLRGWGGKNFPCEFVEQVFDPKPTGLSSSGLHAFL